MSELAAQARVLRAPLDGFALIAPLPRAGAKPALEAGIEQAQVIETTLLRHVDDFGVGIAQEGQGLEQPHFHPQVADG
jgi:hypothetical protein